MLRDIIENTQLAVLNGWTALADMVYPNPVVRQVIRDGNHKVASARNCYTQLRNLLHEEEIQLNNVHREERKNLAEKQKSEKEAQSFRHSAALENAANLVRETRTKVISDISFARSAKSAFQNKGLNEKLKQTEIKTDVSKKTNRNRARNKPASLLVPEVVTA